MLTLLVRYKKSRREVISSATSVEFIPEGSEDIDKGLLIVNNEESVHLSFTHADDENYRDVFVMNDKGQTVARYLL